FWHVGSMPGRTVELEIFGGPHATESGWSSPYAAVHPIFPTAMEAVTELQTGWNRLRAGLLLSTDEQLERRVRFYSYDGQPGPDATGAQVVASVLNEVSHHGTQIGVLRDLFRVR
ncbi:MAG: DinB family protein, partial [Actinomycetota bacterium]|nr:DinB family protein [Actinomycetota bacterium]